MVSSLGPGDCSKRLCDRAIELKLASEMNAPHRLKDLADVLELIRALALPRETGDALNSSVRAKFDELWLAAQTVEPASA